MKKGTAYEGLRNKFPAEEYVLISEVSDDSGFSRSRSLDFMVINLWQSRGLAVTGIERKSYRGDWLKELKNPKKQENHFLYCDYFYLLTDRDGVAKLEEIPETWGWYHINESGVLKTMKSAPKLNPLPIGRGLMCAMLRRAANKDGYIHPDIVESKIEERATEMVQLNRDNNLFIKVEYDKLKAEVSQFEEAFGTKITHSWEKDMPMQLGKIARRILDNGTDDYEKRLLQIKTTVDFLSGSLTKALEELNIKKEVA